MNQRSYRKDKPVGIAFGQGFSWDEYLDAVADIYNGVNFSTNVGPLSRTH